MEDEEKDEKNVKEEAMEVLRGVWCPRAVTYEAVKAGSIDGTDVLAHDRAVSRALNATYTPNSKVQGVPEHTLFIARLSPSTTQNTLQSVFSKFGCVKRCRLVEDMVSGRSKCYAFVEFETESSALKGYTRGRGMRLDGREILVDFECQRLLPGWIPRRLGGGFGGKKESGQLRFGGRDRLFKKPISLLSQHEIKKSRLDHINF